MTMATDQTEAADVQEFRDALVEWVSFDLGLLEQEDALPRTGNW